MKGTEYTVEIPETEEHSNVCYWPWCTLGDRPLSHLRMVNCEYDQGVYNCLESVNLDDHLLTII